MLAADPQKINADPKTRYNFELLQNFVKNNVAVPQLLTSDPDPHPTSWFVTDQRPTWRIISNLDSNPTFKVFWTQILVG